MSSDAGFTSAWDSARAAWPLLTLGAEAFEAFLDARPAGARLHAADLYLAAACLAGERAAIEAFDRLFLAPLPQQLTRRGITRELGEETAQGLRVRLLLGEGGEAPQLQDYDGRGPLGAWVRVVAARTASNARRDEANRVQLAQNAAPPGAAIDPELALVQRKYGAAFEAAVRDAFAVLDAEERTALRLSYANGLNLDGVALALGVSRATAGRRVLSGREKVREETLKLLRARIQATPTELASLLGVVRSKLELSLGALSSSWDGSSRG